MQQPKWTPGPWRVDPGNNCDIQTKTGEWEVATTHPVILNGGPTMSKEHCKANARLIAAAPTLYAACQAALSNQYERTALDEELVAILEQALTQADGERRE